MIALNNLRAPFCIITEPVAYKSKFVADLISGTPADVLINSVAVTVLLTTKSFCTVRSDCTVNEGIIVIPLESSVSMLLEDSVKLPRDPPPPPPAFETHA